MQNNKNDVLKFKKLTKEEISKRDIFGRTILHISILLNDYEYLKILLKNTNIKNILTSCDYENGWNCLHYIIYYKRIICFNLLIDYLTSVNVTNNLFSSNGLLVELLKCKDRCGLTPMQLLNNDFKNFRWIPEFINISDEYNLMYRFIEKNVEEDTKKIVSIKSPQINWDESRGGSDIYVIGCNSNNQLGLGDSKDRSVPISVSSESFIIDQNNLNDINERLQKPRFKSMTISKYHSVVITHDGHVFSCGVGSRGRLGHGDDLGSSFKFKRVEFFDDVEEEPKHIKDVAISNNHSVVLTSDNEVYAWGLNSFNQLGINSPSSNKSNNYLDDFISTPTLVMGELRKHRDEKLLGIAVSKIHSVTWSKYNLFFWGLNAGQMGIQCINGDIEVKLHDQMVIGEIQASPKLISLRDEIKFVSTSELCTCVITVINDIHVYYNFQHFKLPKIPIKGLGDKHFDLFKPTRLTEAAIIKKIITRGADTSMVLLSNGSVMSFSININDVKNTKYNTIWKAHNDDMVAMDFDCGTDGSVVLCTKNGSVFLKIPQSNQRKNSMSAATLPIPVNNKNKFKKLEHINKIVRVVCDPKFLSFGFIRDDIDLLPIELNKNDFLVDIEQLSPLSDCGLHRKQEQLMNRSNGSKHSYLSSFYDDSKADDDDEEDWGLNSSKINSGVEDRLNTLYRHSNSLACKISDRYEFLSKEESKTIEEVLKSDETYLLHTFCSYNKSNDLVKNYDGIITFENYPDSTLGFHIDILAHSSSKFKLLLHSDNNVIVGKKFKAEWDSKSSKLIVKSKTKVLSLLLFVQSIYTNKKIDFYSTFESRYNVPKELKVVQSEYEEIVETFNLKLSQVNLITSFSDLLMNSKGDVVFSLKDGQMVAHSYILKVRSAFFETILSERWDMGETTLDFSGVSNSQMMLILNHIYGVDNKNILNSLDFKYEERDSFINEILEMIEIVDELLLFDLKSVLEVSISGMINLDNVLVLLTHADYLTASKLFMNCCWYIYNNLEVLIYDPSFISIPEDVLSKLEAQILILDKCKFVDSPTGQWIDHNVKVEEFIDDIDKFNEYFMSDRKGFASFEPLVDSRLEVKKVKEPPPKKKKSRKSSTLNSDIIDFRANWANSNGNSPSNQRLRESSVAVEDPIDSHFIVVEKKRKPKFIDIPKADPPPETIKSNTESKSKAINIPINPVTIRSTSLTGLSPHSTWASSSNPFNQFSDRSNSPTPEPPNLIETKYADVKQFKPKIGPHVKLSQKERKKLASAAALSEANKQAPPPEPKNEISDIAPWSSIQSQSPPNTSNKFPALSLKKNKSSNTTNTTKIQRKPSPPSSSTVETKFSTTQMNSSSSSLSSIVSTPSLAEIMLNETLQKEQLKEDNLQRKSLSEIQKEQEFEKWWQEESKRVQKEMGKLNVKDIKKKNGNGGFRKSSSPKSQKNKDVNNSKNTKAKSSL